MTERAENEYTDPLCDECHRLHHALINSAGGAITVKLVCGLCGANWTDGHQCMKIADWENFA